MNPTIIAYTIILSLCAVIVLTAPDIIGWLRFAWACRDGCAATLGG